MFLLKVEPLEIVTGEPPNGPAPLARLTAILKAWSKSIIEPLRLIELPRRIRRRNFLGSMKEMATLLNVSCVRQGLHLKRTVEYLVDN
jgi:hypothetical protein